jgi:hypothetical protein
MNLCHRIISVRILSEKAMTLKLSRLFIPLTALAMSLAVSIEGYAAQGRKVSAPQKRRVAARGHLTGARDLQQVVTWQTSNPPGGTLPYAKAHLAIETVGAGRRVIWQTDGGETQYMVDSIQSTDLDSDGVPEIISLWWEGASAGAVLRIFHWDRAKQSFVELRSDNMSSVHSYRVRPGRGSAKNRIVVYSRSDMNARRPAQNEYEVRGEQIIRVRGGGSVTTEGESGIEGQALISPARPGPIRMNDPRPDKQPYETTLAIVTVGENREVARLKTGSDGRFRVKLPPGEYEIIPAPDTPRRFPRAFPQQVTVLPGQFARVTIEFDSGMR